MPYITKNTLKSGRNTYQVVVRLRGFPLQTATFDKLKDAKEWAVTRESDLRQQRYHHDGTAKKYSVGDLIHQYIEKILYTKTTKEKTSA